MPRNLPAVALIVLPLALAGCGVAAPSTGSSSHRTAGATRSASARRSASTAGSASATRRTSSAAASASSTTSVGSAPDAALLREARAALPELVVKGSSAVTGYSRSEFGDGWKDPDHNGCDARNDVLNRDLTQRTWRSGTDHCVVLTGTLADPYTGQVIHFTKKKASAIQIDHVFPLKALWMHGASRWSQAQREAVANDPLELLAVDGHTNMSKGDATPAAWMPPDRAAWCGYAVRYIDVASRYQASVSQADKDMLTRALGTCQG